MRTPLERVDPSRRRSHINYQLRSVPEPSSTRWSLCNQPQQAVDRENQELREEWWSNPVYISARPATFSSLLSEDPLRNHLEAPGQTQQASWEM